MKRKKLRFGAGFRVALGNRASQAAEMVIKPGKSEGGPQNRHRGADQWLYVESGTGTARVNGRRVEIRNTGADPLKTLNFYVPPAYDAKGDELSRGRG